MKLSFPYMGCVTGYVKLFERFGHDIIPPARPTQRTFDLGVKYSPEFMCFPYKVMMGTYIEAAEKGVDVIASSGGNGPCRAGLYGELHEKTLKTLGYDVDVVIFDSMFRDFKAFMEKITMMKNKRPLYKIPGDVMFAWRIISQMDAFEKKIKQKRPYEVHPGDFNRVFNSIRELYENCKTHADVTRAHKKGKALMKSVEIREPEQKDRIRVGIVGEIYVAMEGSVNMEIEETLNSLGAETENDMYLSNWLQHNILPAPINFSRSHRVIKKAKRFVKMNCGGHDMENIGWMIDFKERGFDAVVHLMPFGCLPELISNSIIPSISKELDMPILSLSLDEQMGTAHNHTRIEAFMDLVKSKHYNMVPKAEAPGWDPINGIKDKIGQISTTIVGDEAKEEAKQQIVV